MCIAVYDMPRGTDEPFDVNSASYDNHPELVYRPLSVGHDASANRLCGITISRLFVIALSLSLSVCLPLCATAVLLFIHPPLMRIG